MERDAGGGEREQSEQYQPAPPALEQDGMRGDKRGGDENEDGGAVDVLHHQPGSEPGLKEVISAADPQLGHGGEGEYGETGHAPAPSGAVRPAAFAHQKNPQDREHARTEQVGHGADRVAESRDGNN